MAPAEPAVVDAKDTNVVTAGAVVSNNDGGIFGGCFQKQDGEEKEGGTSGGAEGMIELDINDVRVGFGLPHCGLVVLGRQEQKCVPVDSTSGADGLSTDRITVNTITPLVMKHDGSSLQEVEMSERVRHALYGTDANTPSPTDMGTGFNLEMYGDGSPTHSLCTACELVHHPDDDIDTEFLVLVLQSVTPPTPSTAVDPLTGATVLVVSVDLTTVHFRAPLPHSGDTESSPTVISIQIMPSNTQHVQNGIRVFSTLWSDGTASFLTLRHTATHTTDNSTGTDDETTTTTHRFALGSIPLACAGTKDTIVAVDLFVNDSDLFTNGRTASSTTNPDLTQSNPTDMEVDKTPDSTSNEYYDEVSDDEAELYGPISTRGSGSLRANDGGDNVSITDDSHVVASLLPLSSSFTSTSRFVSVCFQSGNLRIHRLLDDASSEPATSISSPVWEAYGAGMGLSLISPFYNPGGLLGAHFTQTTGDTTPTTSTDQTDDKAVPPECPASNNTSYPTSPIVEMSVCVIGPIPSANTAGDMNMSTHCLILRNADDDVQVYTARRRQITVTNPSPSNTTTTTGGTATALEWSRTDLGVVTRSSILEKRHRNTLRRKGMLPPESGGVFRYNVLHPFVMGTGGGDGDGEGEGEGEAEGEGGHAGVFLRTSRPLWLVAERGRCVPLYHRMKHAAAGSPNPIQAFCPYHAISSNSSSSSSSGFVTVHERIGRVGSQRLSLHSTPSLLTQLFSPRGFFPGGGLIATQYPLHVTVRHISAVNDPAHNSANLPFGERHHYFAVIVTRESLIDQSHLNDDGLSSDQRERVSEEKEAAKTRRQVEADLGGFDIEQEWVEEIEREDCFGVDVDLGNAPPMATEEHEVWLVDGAQGWDVVDKVKLKEFEHGMSLYTGALTDVSEDVEGVAGVETSTADPVNTVFVAVGTGIVDQDGEDISSKGRVLLFQIVKGNATDAIKKEEDDEQPTSTPNAQLRLVSEKDVLLGPVTSLSRITCDNKHRLVVGAGAEVTVEQWGSVSNGATESGLQRLTQVGFFHANMQVQDLLIFKNFLLLCDAYDSLHFLVWRESDKSLTLLAKDYDPTPVYATGLISRGGAMAFVCHDDRQNFQWFQYAPKDGASRGGNKLVPRADFHLGCTTTKLRPHWCRSSLLVHSSTPGSTLVSLKNQDPSPAGFGGNSGGRREDESRFAVHYGTCDGSFGTVLPVSEQVFWRLSALQSVMSNALESACALSDRAWRMYRRTPRRGGCRSQDRKKSVLDGGLLVRFVDLSRREQSDLAGSIGSTVHLILDNLLELECANMVV